MSVSDTGELTTRFGTFAPDRMSGTFSVES